MIDLYTILIAFRKKISIEYMPIELHDFLFRIGILKNASN